VDGEGVIAPNAESGDPNVGVPTGLRVGVRLPAGPETLPRPIRSLGDNRK
jgi:hypothetical protein